MDPAPQRAAAVLGFFTLNDKIGNCNKKSELFGRFRRNQGDGISGALTVIGCSSAATGGVDDPVLA